MKKRFLSLILACSLLLTSFSAQGYPSLDLVQDVSDFKFEGVDRHPKSDKSLDGEWVKILKFTSFGIIFFTPIGLLNFGLAENLAVTNQLLGIEGLNKAVLECNEKKLTPLSSVLGKDDQDLFISYLRAKQTFTTPTGKKISLQVLNKKDRMQTSMQKTREVVRNFILHLKERKQLPESIPLLEEKINNFLRQFGYVVFSENTLKTLSTRREISPLQMESLLLKKLAKVHILTKEGQIYQEPKKDLRERVKKVFTPKKYAQSEARAKLIEIGFDDKEEQLLLLHDLGYLGLEDLQLLKEERWSQTILEKHTKGLDILKMNPHFYQDWGKKLDTLLTHHLTYEYHLQEALDRLILESLVGQKDMKQYAKENLLPKSPKSEHGRLHLLRLAAMHEWRLQQSSATFLDLETLLVNIKGEMIKHFSARNVQSKNFTILRVKGENIAEAALSYVVGTGFMTTGAASTLTTYYPIFTSYLSVILQQNIAMAMAYVHYITPWGLIVGGGVAGVLTLSKLITHSLQYHQLSQDKGLLAKEIDAIDQQLEQSSLKEHEKNKLKAMKLFDLMDKYLLLKKQKLLFGNLEMDSLWLAISIVAASLGVVAFLSVIGVVASIVMPYVGLGVHLFFLLCFLIYVVLYMNEKRLTDDLLLSSKAFAVYKQIYQMATEEEKDFSPAQKEFLELCFQHVHRSLSMAKYAQGITSTRLEFLQGTNYERMEEQFTQLWFYKMKMRYHAHKILKKERKAQMAESSSLLPLEEAALTYQRNELDKFNLDILKPEFATYPLRPLHQVGEKVYLRKMSESIDYSLMQIFTKAIHIHNAVKYFDEVYQKAIHQQDNLKIFDKHLTREEIAGLLRGHHINDPKDLLMLYDGPDGIERHLKNLTSQNIFRLDRLYDAPVKMDLSSSKEEISLWKKELLHEIREQIAYMEQEYKDLKSFTKGAIDRLPPHHLSPLKEMAPSLHFYLEKWTYLK